MRGFGGAAGAHGIVISSERGACTAGACAARPGAASDGDAAASAPLPAATRMRTGRAVRNEDRMLRMHWLV